MYSVRVASTFSSRLRRADFQNYPVKAEEGGEAEILPTTSDPDRNNF